MDENNDEIILGVNIPKQEKKKLKKNKKSKKDVGVNTTKKEKKSKTISGKKSFRIKLIKRIILFVLIIIAAFFILSSSIFDIKTINIDGNNVVSKDELLTLMQIGNNRNIFSLRKKDIRNSLKQNAYIEDVSIERKLPNILNVSVKERTIKYLIKIGDAYAYVSNQGYILDISNETKEVPIILGINTDLAELKKGERLNENDLKKFDMLNRITETLNNNGLLSLVSKIDVTDIQNYTLYLDSEGKIAYLGNCSDLNTRILYVKAIIEQEAGIEGEIFVNVDLNEENVFFREKID